MISGILAVFTARYSQPRDAFLVPTSIEAHGLSFLAAVQSTGPGSHPKGWCRPALGRGLRPASVTSAHLAPVGAARCRAGVCAPSRCCLLPALPQLTSFIYRSQISQDPPTPAHCTSSEPSPQILAGYPLSGVPQAHWTHCPTSDLLAFPK